MTWPGGTWDVCGREAHLADTVQGAYTTVARRPRGVQRKARREARKAEERTERLTRAVEAAALHAAERRVERRATRKRKAEETAVHAQVGEFVGDDGMRRPKVKHARVKARAQPGPGAGAKRRRKLASALRMTRDQLRGPHPNSDSEQDSASSAEDRGVDSDSEQDSASSVEDRGVGCTTLPTEVVHTTPLPNGADLGGPRTPSPPTTPYAPAVKTPSPPTTPYAPAVNLKFQFTPLQFTPAGRGHGGGGDSGEPEPRKRLLGLDDLQRLRLDGVQPPLEDWLRRGEEALRRLSLAHVMVSEAAAIAMIIGRADAGTRVAMWFSALPGGAEAAVRWSFSAFRDAFLQRFGDQDLLQEHLLHLETINLADFSSLGDYYDRFCSHVGRIGTFRSVGDLHRNFKRGLPAAVQERLEAALEAKCGPGGGSLANGRDIITLEELFLSTKAVMYAMQLAAGGHLRGTPATIRTTPAPSSLAAPLAAEVATLVRHYMAQTAAPMITSPDRRVAARQTGCWHCGISGHERSTCPSLGGRPSDSGRRHTAAQAAWSVPVRPAHPPDGMLNAIDEDLAQGGGSTVVVIPVTVQGVAARALVDTGASISCAHPQLVARLQLAVDAGNRVTLTLADGSRCSVSVTMPVMLSFGGISAMQALACVAGPADVIIGMDVLQRVGAVVDCQRRTIAFDATGAQVRALGPKGPIEQSGMHPLRHELGRVVQACEAQAVEEQEYHRHHASAEVRRGQVVLMAQQAADEGWAIGHGGTHVTAEPSWESTDLMSACADAISGAADGEDEASVGAPSLPDITAEEMHAAIAASVESLESAEQRAQARSLLLEFADVFRRNVDARAPMDATPHVIFTTSEAPVGYRQRSRYTAAQQAFIATEVLRLESLGVIERSTSLFNNPIVLVPKGDSWRMCHDFRALNAITVPLESAIPLIDDVLDAIPASTIFSRMDATNGYFQVPLDASTAHKTAFTCSLGCFQYRRTALGLRNIPAVFNAIIVNHFHGVRDCLVTYFDDFLAHSGTFVQHLRHLRSVLTICRLRRIALNLQKSLFFQCTLDMLGFCIAPNRLLLPNRACAVIRNMPTPGTSQEVLRFLGLVGYYRRFIHRFADIAAPLVACAHGPRGVFTWSSPCQTAFIQLRDALCTSPVLRIPARPHQPGYQPFVLYCDASDLAIAGILSQAVEDKDGILREHPCMYWSRQLTGPERNYSVTEREALAIVFACTKGRLLLLDSHFTIVTDHEPLTFLLRNRTPTGRLARWIAALQAFSFTLRFRAGATHTNVDALTRRPVVDTESQGFGSIAETVAVLGPVAQVTMPLGLGCPEQARRPTGASVLAITRAASRAEGRTHSSGSSGLVTKDDIALPHPRMGNPAEARAKLSPEITDGHANRAVTPPLSLESTTGLGSTVPEEQVLREQLLQAMVGRQKPKPGESANSEPGAGRVLRPCSWHEEIWLATGVLRMLGGHVVTDGPEKYLRRMREMARLYRGVFIEGAVFPIAIFAVPGVHPDVPAAGPYLEVPAPSRRLGLVLAAHEMGHFGVFKTLERVRQEGVWWLGLAADVETIVQMCPACKRDNTHRAQFHPALALPPPVGVMHRVHMDLLSLPPAAPLLIGGPPRQYLLLFVCALTKFPIAFVLDSKEAVAVAHCLWQVICMFGSPLSLVSDNGVEFVNGTVAALTSLHGISRRLTSVYRPQANGQVERFNRSVVTILRKLTGAAPELWPEWVDFVMLVIRTSVHRSSLATPFCLMFGRQWNPLSDYHQLLIDWEQLAAKDAGMTQLEAAVIQRTILLRHRLHGETVLQASQRGLQAAAMAGRRSQDAAHLIVQHRVATGAQVWLRNERQSSKLDHQLVGPFTVVDSATEKQSSSMAAGNTVAADADRDVSRNYRLRAADGVQLVRSVAREKLFVPVPCVISARQQTLFSKGDWGGLIDRLDNVEPGPLSRVTLPGNVAASTSYAMETIVQERAGRAGGREYLVKWVGYAQPSWEPESAFHSAPQRELLRERRAQQLGRGSVRFENSVDVSRRIVP